MINIIFDFSEKIKKELMFNDHLFIFVRGNKTMKLNNYIVCVELKGSENINFLKNNLNLGDLYASVVSDDKFEYILIDASKGEHLKRYLNVKIASSIFLETKNFIEYEILATVHHTINQSIKNKKLFIDNIKNGDKK